jgi:hypothetical protein
VLAFATSAPSQIAGQSERPHSSRAACAMPVGAHTVVICSATNANRNPSLAATTYATARASPIPTNRRASPVGVGGSTQHARQVSVTLCSILVGLHQFSRRRVLLDQFPRISWFMDTIRMAGRTSCIRGATVSGAYPGRPGRGLAQRWVSRRMAGARDADGIGTLVGVKQSK